MNLVRLCSSLVLQGMLVPTMFVTIIAEGCENDEFLTLVSSLHNRYVKVCYSRIGRGASHRIVQFCLLSCGNGSARTLVLVFGLGSVSKILFDDS